MIERFIVPFTFACCFFARYSEMNRVALAGTPKCAMVSRRSMTPIARKTSPYASGPSCLARIIR